MKAVIVAFESPKKTGANRRIETLGAYLKENGFDLEYIVVSAGKGPRILRFVNPVELLKLRRELKLRNSDLTIFCGLEFFIAAHVSTSKKNALDVCDSQAMLLESQDFRSGGLFSSQMRSLAIKLMYSFTPKDVGLTYITKIDCEMDKRYNSRNKTSHFGNLPDERLTSLGNERVTSNSIGFVADFSYAPNANGLDWFLTQVFPFLHGSRKLNLYGPVRPSFENNQVRYEGYVPDITQIYRANSVFIAPDFGGAGQKNKVIEALVAGKPVIATSRASAGLGEVEGLIISDEPLDWIATLNTPELKEVYQLESHKSSSSIQDILNQGRLNFRNWIKELLND